MEELDWDRSEKTELLSRFRKLYKSCEDGGSTQELTLLKNAFRLASNANKEKRRENGDPFVFHAINVANIVLEEIGLKAPSAIAVLLHEAFEIGNLTLDYVQQNYNAEICGIVSGLNKISSIDAKTTEGEAENYRQLVISYSADPRVILIKLADRLDVMRHLYFFSPEKQTKKAKESLTLYAPLAHRLGLYSVKSDLEDLSLKYLEKADYLHITQKLEETAKERNTYIAKFIAPIVDKLNKLGLKFEIKSRTKSVYSIWRKMKKQGIPFEEVFDLFAIRIILNSARNNEKADCWRTYSIVTEKYIPNPERMRDWISVPKSNGYESLHATVIGPEGRWVEVQIRTKRMDEIAEMGIAAHWKYKGIKQEQGIDDWLTDLRALMEQTDDPREMVENLKLDMYQKEIFVFTPNGDLKKIPSEATVLDFAFEVHSKLGVTCVGAKINNRLASIKDKLKNGDQVEIITSKNQKPTKDWLSFVITSKAKSKIKQSLKEEELKVVNLGKELLSRRLKNWKLEFPDDVATQYIKKCKIKSITDFYAMLGNGKIDVADIKDYIESLQHAQEAKASTDELSQMQFSNAREGGDYLVIDEHLANVEYKLATCCNPIFGDDIFGFVTINNGIKIHRTTCPNAKSMMERYGYRIVKARWQQTNESNSFQTTIRIIGEDQMGLFNRISEVLTKEMKVNMRSATFNTKNGLFEGRIKVYVENIKQLDMIIYRINRIKGVLKASRVAISD